MRAMAHSYVCHDSSMHAMAPFICATTQSYVCHDSFICVTWLIHMCDMTHSYVWHDSFHLRHESFGCVCHDSFLCVTWLLSSAPWLIRMFDAAHLCVCHDSFICVPWPIHMCATTSFMCVTWLIRMFDVAHSCVCHDLFIWASIMSVALVRGCDVNHRSLLQKSPIKETISPCDSTWMWYTANESYCTNKWVLICSCNMTHMYL